jgi:hypothetical protein
MTYHRVCNKSNTTDDKCRAGTAYLCRAPEFTPWIFSGVRVPRSLYLCVMFCRSLFVLFCFGHCTVCLFTASDYPFGIFKLLFHLHVASDVITTSTKVCQFVSRPSKMYVLQTQWSSVSLTQLCYINCSRFYSGTLVFS